MIVVARRLLLQAAKVVREGGDPPGVDTSYYSIHAVERVLPTASITSGAEGGRQSGGNIITAVLV